MSMPRLFRDLKDASAYTGWNVTFRQKNKNGDLISIVYQGWYFLFEWAGYVQTNDSPILKIDFSGVLEGRKISSSTVVHLRGEPGDWSLGVIASPDVMTYAMSAGLDVRIEIHDYLRAFISIPHEEWLVFLVTYYSGYVKNYRQVGAVLEDLDAKGIPYAIDNSNPEKPVLKGLFSP